MEKVIDQCLTIIDYTNTDMLSSSIVTLLEVLNDKITMEIGTKVVTQLVRKHFAINQQGELDEDEEAVLNNIMLAIRSVLTALVRQSGGQLDVSWRDKLLPILSYEAGRLHGFEPTLDCILMLTQHETVKGKK